jgi:hypothetical protein
MRSTRLVEIRDDPLLRGKPALAVGRIRAVS